MRVYHLTYSPEVRTACLHFHGCNFRCPFCVRRGNPYDVHLRHPPPPSASWDRGRSCGLLEGTGAEKVILLEGSPRWIPSCRRY